MPHDAGQDHITSLSAVALSQSIRRREISCVEVFDAFFTRIQQWNPQFNALTGLLSYEDGRAQALQHDQLLARGNWLGPLHGMPQAPKDLLPVAGMTTTKGCRAFAEQVSSTDAVVFERMRRSGAIFIGRSNTPELGLGGHTYNDLHGTTCNALHPSLSAGGSSGGAAVAVALNLLPVADGTDMMGSLRTPAAFNQVYGMRTSPGRVPHGPGDDIFFQQLSVSGPMARTVEDLALLLSVQAGFDARLPLSRDGVISPPGTRADTGCQGIRIGWLADLGGYLPMEPGLLDTCEQGLQTLRAIGCDIAPAQPEFDPARLWQAWLDLRSFSVAGANASLYANPATRQWLKPEAIWEIERGQALSGNDIYRATVTRTAWYQAVRTLFSRYDFLVLPGSQVFPFDHRQHWPASIHNRPMDTYHRWLEVTIAASMAGLPALCVPAGTSPAGLPAGLQIIGPVQADQAVLDIGHAYDKARQQAYP